MVELLVKLIPNVMRKPGELYTSILQTLVMVGVSGSISFCIGIVFGVLLVTTSPGGILKNRGVFLYLDKTINLFRSIPFIILLAALIPLTRLVVGTAIGTRGAILPLVFGTVPFFSRQIESALAEVDGGIIEAAKSMGSSPLGIIFRVYLRESIPSIARATTITLVSLTGLTAMAGAVGAGGLGDFAIRYGHQRNQFDVTVVTVLVLLILVSFIQGIGSWIIKRTTH
jgi:D-methionine transport system permease protein